MDWVNLLGYAAAASVLATFCMRTMIPLRILALVSNVLFCIYGYFDNLYPVLILHLILFPVNLYRLIQFQRLIRELHMVHPSDLSIESWLPHMRLRRMRAGETLIRQGDKVDSIYYLLDGHLELPELGKTLDPGAVVGEIGVFAADAKRTATVVCRTDCRIYELSENQAKQLFLQDRKFGFAMMRLVIDRLLENNRRLLETASREAELSAGR
jgi:CRP/FNR family transcriptional regulator, cyclic AMP receptor protein